MRDPRAGQFRDLAAIRKERAQAKMVPIFRVGLKRVVTYCPPESAEARVAELERLNPGRKFEVR